MANNDLVFYYEDSLTCRKKLFEEALLGAQHGRVLYILNEELDELPDLSQEFNALNKHYMKMITFLYVKTLDSLLESVCTLPGWQNIPTTIILDNLSSYCSNDNLHNACGIVALLIDTAKSCSESSKKMCKLCISVTKPTVSEEFYSTIKELYCMNYL